MITQITINKTKIKRRRPQGKISVDKVIKGIMAGKKKKDIAPEAGSLAKSVKAKCNAVTQVMNSNGYKDRAEPFVKQLDGEIKRLMTSITESILLGVGYRDKTSSLEKLVKMQELLQGKPTERQEVDVKDLKKFLNNA